MKCIRIFGKEVTANLRKMTTYTPCGQTLFVLDYYKGNRVIDSRDVKAL